MDTNKQVLHYTISEKEIQSHKEFDEAEKWCGCVDKGMEEGRRLGRSKMDNTPRDVYLDPTWPVCRDYLAREVGVRFIIEEAYGASGNREGEEIH